MVKYIMYHLGRHCVEPILGWLGQSLMNVTYTSRLYIFFPFHGLISLLYLHYLGLGFICSLFYPILHRTPHRGDMIFVN